MESLFLCTKNDARWPLSDLSPIVGFRLARHGCIPLLAGLHRKVAQDPDQLGVAGEPFSLMTSTGLASVRRLSRVSRRMLAPCELGLALQTSGAQDMPRVLSLPGSGYVAPLEKSVSSFTSTVGMWPPRPCRCR